MNMIRHLTFDSPVGPLLLIAQDDVLTRLEFVGRSHAIGPPAQASSGGAYLEEVCSQLTEYFAGSRRYFDLEVRPEGTAFQRRVWAILRDIPWGETCTYGDLADRLGNPDACRSVGAANGRNPVSIILPCHRIIGGNGHITGYAGGLDAKRWLLRHEEWTLQGDRVMS